MNGRKWIILLLAIVTIMSLATYTGATRSLFIDDEQNTDNALNFQWGLFVLNDGFEGVPWDANWDENGTTTWVSSTSGPYSGSYAAESDKFNNGSLTSDDFDASTTNNITVSFWFYGKNLAAGDCLVQIYNGSTYNTWYDITSYPGYTNNAWFQFSEVLSDSQYFIAGFNLRFNSTGLTGGGKIASVDDVVIVTDSLPPAAPGNLTATPADSVITLDWDDNIEPDLSGYNIYRGLSSGNYTQINGSLVLSSNYTDTGLTNGVTYYYVVTAVDIGSNESNYSNEASAAPVDLAPAAPTGLTATPGETVVSLNWTDNTEPDLSGYNIYRSLTSGSGYAQLNGSLVLSSNYTDTGLTNGVTYYYVVTAVDLGSNESSYSNEASATPVDLAPAEPTNLSAIPGDKQVNLNWDDNSEPDLAGYNVYRSLTSGSGYAQLNGSLVLSSSYLDTGLTGGVTYYYVVTAVDNGANESGYSNEASATPTDPPPVAPGNLTATPGDKLVTLNWDDNSEPDLDGYNVYRSTTSGSGYAQINGSPVGSSNYTDTGLTGGVTYYYVVTAVDFAANESSYSNEANATPTDPPPAAPGNLTATPGDKQVSLNWDDNSEPDFDGYNIYRSLTSGSGYAQINGSLVLSSNYTDTGLTGGVTYYYVVTAVDLAANESSYSNEANATPTDPPPAAPGNLTATPGDAEITLDWDDNLESDLAGYNIYRGLSSGNYTQINGSLVLSSNYTDTGLSSGVTYYYVVTAVDNGSNESSYSSEANATPTDAPPAAPGNLTATPGETEITLDWDDNSESDLAGYNIYRGLSSGNYTQINGSLVLSSNYTDTGLTNGVTYYYVVTAVDLGSNESSYSSEASAAPLDLAPAAPTNLTATPANSIITLDWDDNTEPDLAGYNVYRGLSSGNYTQINGSLVLSSNYTDTGLTNGVTYYYVVTAVDLGSNESGYSNETNAAPDGPPVAPTNLSAIAGDKQVSLNWDDNTEPDLAGYNVYRSLTSGSGYAQINGSLVLSSNYTDTGLTGGITYYYVATAVDGINNESSYSNEASATPTDALPSAPANLTATRGTGLVDLNWDDNSESDLSGYNVYRSTTSGSGYAQVNGSLVLSSNYTDSGVTNGIRYYYVVTAVDGGSNESGYSNEANARPVGPPQTLLNDGFEGAPWDANWDANGVTTWLRGTDFYQGTYSARSDNKNMGNLATDNLDTFAAENITVTFWFKLSNTVDTGDILLQTYNGSVYNTWYDLRFYPTYVNNTWCQFSATITDTQYFTTGFRLRFVSSSLSGQERVNIDDVLVEINQ